ncbi:MAG: alpha/beta fold hydrolase [Synergistaceae bacterium]|nr:alpha/beta fold hydrolase [Synergistaceae bacterium]
MLSSQFSPANAELYYEIYGDGPPLLLIAGLGSDSASWQTVVPPLAKHFRVICLDNRGSGRSVCAEGSLSVDLLAEDCAALIGHLGHEKVHVAGHSMGGFIAQRLAVLHPDLADRLVLSATGAKSSRRNVLLFNDLARRLEEGEDSARWFRSLFYWIYTPALFERERALAGALDFALNYPWKQSPAFFRAQVEAIARFDGREGLERISAPVLVLAGEKDLLFPPEECREFAALIPGAKFKILQGAAHSMHAENPRTFAAAVVEFLTEGDNQ